MNEENTILIVIALAAGFYFLSQSKGKSSGAPTQTSPLSNNPNKGINSGKQNTGIADYLNAGVGIVNTIGKEVTGNDSFNALDEVGKLLGGNGGNNDYAGIIV